MKKLGEMKRTQRGFAYIEFKDRYETPCSLQASSLAEYDPPGSSAVWLGVENVHPQTFRQGEGWKDYPVPEDIHFTNRMHLDRKQVTALIYHLFKWLVTNRF